MILLAVIYTPTVCVAEKASVPSLRGSPASLDQQNDEAVRHDFTYLRESSQLRRFVKAGLLVPVGGNRDYTLDDVSFPYARSEVKLFIERLSRQYRRACGEQLVVTSLTRPIANQPRNASPRSVHPTGMAVDLRRTTDPSCRKWLENTLLYLEEQKTLEATRERGPPHYHVAVFPTDYAAYVATRATSRAVADIHRFKHTVGPRDTLWHIAKKYGTTPTEIRYANQLRSSVIHPGQVLRMPSGTEPSQ